MEAKGKPIISEEYCPYCNKPESYHIDRIITESYHPKFIQFPSPHFGRAKPEGEQDD